MTDIAGQPQQHERRLAVQALRTGSRDRLAPRIHHVLNVFGVALEPAHQIVVVLMIGAVERPIGFQHQHGQAGGCGLLELFTDMQHRPLRRGIVRDHRARELLGNIFHMWHKRIRRHRDYRPEHDDRHRENTHHPGNEGPLHAVLALLTHADFTLHITFASA